MDEQLKKLQDKSLPASERYPSILGFYDDESVIDALIYALLDEDEDTEIRVQAAVALGESDTYDEYGYPVPDPKYKFSQKVVGALSAAMQDKDDDVRIAAILSLKYIGNPGAVDTFVAALKDSNVSVRIHAVNALAEMGGDQYADELSAALGDSDESIRKLAAEKLVEIGGDKSISQLNAALDANNLPVVAGVYEFFIRQGRAGSEETLVSALDQYGNEDMAVAFLNCGNQKLSDAARAWAKNNNYLVMPDSFAGSQINWGG